VFHKKKIKIALAAYIQPNGDQKDATVMLVYFKKVLPTITDKDGNVKHRGSISTHKFI